MKKKTSDLKKKCVDAWVQLAQKYCALKGNPSVQLAWDIIKLLVFLFELYMSTR